MTNTSIISKALEDVQNGLKDLAEGKISKLKSKKLKQK